MACRNAQQVIGSRYNQMGVGHNCNCGAKVLHIMRDMQILERDLYQIRVSMYENVCEVGLIGQGGWLQLEGRLHLLLFFAGNMVI
jgi:hypothetical protein